MTRYLRFALPLCLSLVACTMPNVPEEVAGGQDGGSAADAGAPVKAPADLAYDALTPTYTLGKAITPNNPSLAGGVATSFAVTPTLPDGLILDASTGILSGTPTKLSPAAHYTVTASNEAGSTTVDLQLSVVDAPPEGLTYAVTSPSYTINEAIKANAPFVSGGPVVSYAVDPALPTGLALDAETGVISGTPTALSPAATYTVTATNSGGAMTIALTITVVDLPPTNIAYHPPQLNFTKDETFTFSKPTVTGGAATVFSISPALPAGLAINSATGAIGGTPTVLLSFTTFQVTATNSGGSVTVDLMLRVVDTIPLHLQYSNADVVATLGQPITDLIPSHQGGPINGYSLPVNPLPDGLHLDAVTGVISGTPTKLSPRTEYTVTGYNTGGTSSTLVRITVNDVQPSTLMYTAATATYMVGVPITDNAPTSSGGAVTSYAVSPDLPDGLSLDTSTGIITGTPTTATGLGYYTVTATNSGGSTSTDLTITVDDAVP